MKRRTQSKSSSNRKRSKSTRVSRPKPKPKKKRKSSLLDVNADGYENFKELFDSDAEGSPDPEKEEELFLEDENNQSCLRIIYFHWRRDCG